MPAWPLTPSPHRLPAYAWVNAPTLTVLAAMVVGLIWSAPAPAPAQQPEPELGPGDHRLWITAAGLRREYLLHDRLR